MTFFAHSGGLVKGQRRGREFSEYFHCPLLAVANPGFGFEGGAEGLKILYRRDECQTSYLLVPDRNFRLQQACHKFVMTRMQACHKFVMIRVQACSKLTKASKSPWNELAASLQQACRANSLQIIAKTEYKRDLGIELASYCLVT
ncbi:hypothetical protein AVEN_217453-1 [Araneus ventricosus]|uniref:Uncharacterized protein n=1 Tax=Araneus ventricosus TaxID=182803 RepID=A0A4Y2TX00_ARAVE|nr:hypothetical protein AVEN_217453-1 [Araneus ventricosus]